MGYQFNPLTGNLDLVGGGGGNPFDQELNTSNLPTFNAVFLNDPNGNPDQTTTVSAGGIANSASSDSSFSLNANGVGFQVADTSTSFTAGQIAYTPSGGTQKTYALPPASGTLATTESISFPVTSVNGNTGAVVLDTATFVPPAWINIVNNATDLDVPQITAGYWFLQSGTYGTTTAVYVPNGSFDSHLKVYYSTTDNLWHIVATGSGGDYPEYTTSNSSGYPANFTITGVSNTDGNTYTRSITFTHGNTVITPTSILSAGTSRYASRLDHTHPVISASDISSGTLNSARLPATAVTTTGTQTLTNKTLTTPNVGNGSTNAILTAYTANILSVANSTTACGFSIFNTRTDASNYEAGIFDFTTNANSLTIGTTKAGSGTARRVRINSAEQIDFYCTDTSRMFQVSTSAVTSFNAFGFQWFSSASDPTTSSTPFSNGSSYCAVYKNTTSGIVSLWVRDGSTMKKIALV
jgi:hypothetical protein